MKQNVQKNITASLGFVRTANQRFSIMVQFLIGTMRRYFTNESIVLYFTLYLVSIYFMKIIQIVQNETNIYWNWYFFNNFDLNNRLCV